MQTRTAPLVLAAALVLAACGDAAEPPAPTGRAPAGTVPAAPTPSAPTLPAPPDPTLPAPPDPTAADEGPRLVDWQPPGAGPDVGQVAGLAAGPGGVVAWGNDLGLATGDAAIAWSADGLAWEPPVGFAGYQIGGVAAGGPGYVAIGGRYLEPGAGAEARFEPAAWWSADGRTWHQAAVEPSPEIATAGTAWAEPLGRAPVGGVVAARATPDIPVIEGTWLAGVVADGETLLAFGPSPETGRRNVLWTSADGTSWTGVGGRPFGDAAAEVRQIAAGPTGFVAWGSVATPFHSPGALVTWWSADGLAWERTPPGDGFDRDGVGPLVAGVATVEGRFVLVGSLWEGRAQAWTSADGRAWGAPAPLPMPGGPAAGLRDLASNGQVLVGVGLESAHRGDAVLPVIVQSDDGAGWERVPPARLVSDGDDFVSVEAAAWLHDRWIALGHRSGAGSRATLVWVGR